MELPTLNPEPKDEKALSIWSLPTMKAVHRNLQKFWFKHRVKVTAGWAQLTPASRTLFILLHQVRIADASTYSPKKLPHEMQSRSLEVPDLEKGDTLMKMFNMLHMVKTIKDLVMGDIDYARELMKTLPSQLLGMERTKQKRNFATFVILDDNEKFGELFLLPKPLSKDQEILIERYLKSNYLARPWEYDFMLYRVGFLLVTAACFAESFREKLLGRPKRSMEVVSAYLGCKVCKNPEGPNQESLKACAKCRLAHYCSKECQTVDWPLHKPICNKEG
ncbi:hypothetical protein HK100_008226 [Physocladia obscura]|uniref:MYND-type domain-containing protein n=1 Tax=Physocladia obscura TaxID=109957 RepID=A0AAD5SPN5_9FUNG|nr:hypothetical protein HK100_008226 [Physocladia obscura]